MRVDLTRSTFRPEHGYSGVIIQQGRVQLDADANEATAIGLHRDRTTAFDVVGPHGAPRGDGGFAVSAVDGDLLVAPGRIYVAGILVEAGATAVAVVALTTETAELAALTVDGRAIATCQWLELRAAGVASRQIRVTSTTPATRQVTFTPALSQVDVNDFTEAGATVVVLASYTSQPHMPAPPLATSGDPCPTLQLSDGVWATYLDVWERAVTARDDPRLREPALGGPDTTARSQVVWQLQLVQLSDDPSADVECRLPASSPPGGLQARAQPTEAVATDCEVPAGAGYRRLENQLYRVEVHAPSSPGPATFTWSRENASVVASWIASDDRTLLVDRTGVDDVRGFGPGDVVELTDRTRELAGESGVVVEIQRVDDDGLHLTSDPPDRADFDAHAIVRRWDDRAGPREIERPAENGGWLALEDGVEIRFALDGAYHAGDYWLVPARTATGDVEWPRDADDARTPLVRRPDGVMHHRSILALVRQDGEAPLQVSDCRPLFPPLTDLRAGDVTVHPGLCDLDAGTTVQETLEALCRERDLRHHNRHLHGWGIVCGLRVTCGPDGDDRRSRVTVHEGYAIDPSGTDVLADTETLDLLDMVEEQAPDAIDDEGDGDVCLNVSLNGGLRPRYSVERYQPDEEDELSSILSGTLIGDFYADCILPVQQFLEEELRAPEDGEEGEVHPARERLAAVTNLAVQPFNPTTGQHVFLSPREHEVLSRFYVGLRALLTSETFCAMFENARPFPEYPLERPGLDTIFGRGSHTRLRVNPNGREAYTLGPGLNPARPATTINRYDLTRDRLVETINPLAGADLSDGGDSGAGAVEDVAFSPDGRLIYVIAPTRNEANTFFRVGVIRPGGISWLPVVTICGIKLVTLATTEADRNAVYAVGVVDEPPEDPATTRAGLYRIIPEQVDPNMDPLVRFNAAGHMRITANGEAFVTAAAETVSAERYSRVINIRLPGGQRLTEFTVPEGVDDLAIRPHPSSARVLRVYTVAGPNPERRKFVVAHDVVIGQRVVSRGEVEVDNTAIRLEPFEPTGMLLVTSEDGYSLRLINVEEHALMPEYLLPMQVGPVSVAAVPDGERALVLNNFSNTVVTAEARVLTPEFDTQVLLDALAEYRADALEAFADLLAGFLQYLKDCFCDKFLIECPDDDPTGTLSLACISIRDNEVYRVCNFSRRRYVKSFPTVEYWLSVVPILPLLRKAFEELCCAVLPDLFRYTAPRNEEHSGTGRVRVGTVRAGAGQAQAFDLASRLFGARRSFRQSGQIAVEDLGRRGSLVRARGDARTALGGLVGQSADRAGELLLDRGFDVRRTPYEPDLVAQLTSRLVSALRTPRPGSEITLHVEDERVRTFAVTGAPETVELRREMTTLTDTVAEREEELADLRAEAETHRARLEEVGTLQQAVADTERRLAERDEQITTLLDRLESLEAERTQGRALADLQAGLEDLRTFRNEVRRFMDRTEE